MTELVVRTLPSPSGVQGPGPDTYKGWLFKWTNYLKGYQRRWFVLSNGLLSYYRYVHCVSFDAHEEHSRLSARVTLLCHPFHSRYIICVVLCRVRVAQKF